MPSPKVRRERAAKGEEYGLCANAGKTTSSRTPRMPAPARAQFIIPSWKAGEEERLVAKAGQLEGPKIVACCYVCLGGRRRARATSRQRHGEKLLGELDPHSTSQLEQLLPSSSPHSPAWSLLLAPAPLPHRRRQSHVALPALVGGASKAPTAALS